MRRLNNDETDALVILANRGSICLGDAAKTELGSRAQLALDGLVRKKRASVEATDDGPRYHLTAQGRSDAS